MTPLRNDRGHVLIVVIVAMAVMMVIVVGAIRFTGTNRDAASHQVEADRLEACTEAARKMLLAKLRTYGIQAADLTLNEVINDSHVDAEKSRIQTAHYTSSDGGTGHPLTVVPISSSAMGASRRQARDLSNTLPGSATLGGQYYRVVVKCQLGNLRESELEFVFRHGI